MKDRTDFALVRALLKKQGTERANSYKKGNFDAVGLVVRLLLIALFLTAFLLFYGKFADIYLSVRTNGAEDRKERMFELLSISYALILLVMTVGGVSQLLNSLFAADDIKLFSAMPVGAKTLFVSRLIELYIRQCIYAAVIVLPVNFTLAAHAGLSVWFYLATLPMCLLMPLVSIGIASLFALPFYALWQFLKPRYVAAFLAGTVALAALLFAYSVVLRGVKELLLGDGLRYFFNENVMRIVQGVARRAYPCSWIANIMLGREFLVSGLSVAAVICASLALSFIIIRNILSRALQSRIAGTRRFVRSVRKIGRQTPVFFSLMKKEFLQILRTPSYVFSYFSVALVMPLMVYFCMDVGSSLVMRLIGIDCALELSVFLTILFGALTNAFCATNISRDGEMFYSVKAMPVGWRTVIFSKVALCMCVTVLSQAVSAALIGGFSFVNAGEACFVFFVGVLCSFAQICLATRRDLDHARFSTEEDGEIKESGNSVTVLIVVGMLVSFLVGGSLLFVRMALALRGVSLGYLSYLVASGFSVIAAAAGCFYLLKGLGKKYTAFSGGGLF